MNSHPKEPLPGLLPDLFESRIPSRDRTLADRVSRLHFDYQIDGPSGMRQVQEVHELGLFTPDELRKAFVQAGLVAEYDTVGLAGRGLWTARDAA